RGPWQVKGIADLGVLEVGSGIQILGRGRTETGGTHLVGCLYLEVQLPLHGVFEPSDARGIEPAVAGRQVRHRFLVESYDVELTFRIPHELVLPAIGAPEIGVAIFTVEDRSLVADVIDIVWQSKYR